MLSVLVGVGACISVPVFKVVGLKTLRVPVAGGGRGVV